jgi:hypothetical protein
MAAHYFEHARCQARDIERRKNNDAGLDGRHGESGTRASYTRKRKVITTKKYEKSATPHHKNSQRALPHSFVVSTYTQPSSRVGGIPLVDPFTSFIFEGALLRSSFLS